VTPDDVRRLQDGRVMDAEDLGGAPSNGDAGAKVIAAARRVGCCWWGTARCPDEQGHAALATALAQYDAQRGSPPEARP
jgi:hypothetical protein